MLAVVPRVQVPLWLCPLAGPWAGGAVGRGPAADAAGPAEAAGSA
jgi:hypothetical protein